jgi:hypothetical protein
MLITGIVVALALIAVLAANTNGFALLLLVGVVAFGWQRYRGGNNTVGMGTRSREGDARRLAEQATAPERERARQRTQQEAEAAERFTRLEDIEEILKLSPKDFEQMMAKLLSARGCKDVQVVGKRGDLAVDITARDSAGRSMVVQCKRWAPTHKIGSLDIQHFIGMAHVHHHAERMLFVTTSDYTADARTLAKQHNIQLMNGMDVVVLARQRRRPASKQPPNASNGRTHTRTSVRLSCQHVEVMIGNPVDMVGRRMLCRTCGEQRVEAVL